MKVTTEGCLLGAWSAANATRPKRILDIGAGTGLLSLMLVQAFPQAEITAVELNPDVAAECLSNFESSPWSNRLSMVCSSIQTFERTDLYDLIISNPPFFAKSLPAALSHEHMARHADQLSVTELVLAIDQSLAPDGEAIVLFPPREMQMLQDAAAGLLFPVSCLEVHSVENGPVFRQIVKFKKVHEETGTTVLSIKNGADYTPEFVELLQPYYLYL